MAVTNTKQTMKTVYLRAYGHNGKRTTAMIANKMVGKSQVFGSAVSNLNEANFDLELASDFYNCLGYLSFGTFYGLVK